MTVTSHPTLDINFVAVKPLYKTQISAPRNISNFNFYSNKRFS